ncbi:MAG: aminopeptidase P family protein [Persephonella sp.]|nr:MAG: aminopeptidase P family protein [Persephonella sp.]
MEKIGKVINKIKAENLSSFFFSSHSNVFYLTGFSSTNAFVLLTEKNRYFFTDNRYYLGAKKKLKDWEVILIEGLNDIKDNLISLGGNRIGFEKDKNTISFYENLTSNSDLDKKLIGYAGFLDEIRAIKTGEEINTIKEAVEKTDEIFNYIVNNINSFSTELDVRREIVNQIFLKKGEGESFPAIVAFGENSAIPHYQTSDIEIKRGAPLLIDMGMKYKGYCSDFTRTIFIGNVSQTYGLSRKAQKLRDIYEIVKEANIEATNIVKEGITAREVDLKARELIKRYGYGDYFIHSTGHGIGIDIHEFPRISYKSDTVLKEGMIFTIEPGIYIKGLGGVRLENVVLCKKDKGEVLTKTSLDLIEV